MAGKSKVHTIYKTKNNVKVPGTTTVTGLLDKSGALIHWAWDLGKKGIDYRKFKDNLADIGTLAHDLVVCHLTNKEPDVSDYSQNQIDQAENALISFFEWQKGKEIEVVFAERPLVSEEHLYGGTPDILAFVDGELTLIDIKTGKAIYDETSMQIAAYEMLIREVEKEALDKRMILRIGRDETEGFEVRPYSKEHLAVAWAIFKHLLQIYYLKKSLKSGEV